jgi:6-phosphogluconolactonase
MTGDLEVFPDAAAVAAAVADLFVDTACCALAERGKFHVALSGGNTPRAAYELLAQQARSREISWSDVFIYFGDERCVPSDDEQSNYRMAKLAFLDAVPIPPANVHRMRGEIDPAEAARDYAAVLRTDLGDSPSLDLTLLGLGPDGHTASLFPGSPPEADDASLVRAVYSDSRAQWRITITPKVINASRTVAFAVEGVEKAAILAAVLEGPRDPVALPSQIVAPSPGRLLWLADKAAAGTLRTK